MRRLDETIRHLDDTLKRLYERHTSESAAACQVEAPAAIRIINFSSIRLTVSSNRLVYS